MQRRASAGAPLKGCYAWRWMRTWVAWTFAGAAGLLCGCSLVARPIIDHAAEGSEDASLSDGQIDNASGDGESPRDAGPQPTAPCSPLDCTNPDCVDAGYRCIPLPAGFTYIRPSNGGCASNDVAQRYLLDVSWSPASCTCNCTPPNCQRGSWLERADCNPGTSVSHPAGDGGCIQESVSLQSATVALVPAPPKGGGCSTAAVDKPDAIAAKWEGCVPAQNTAGCGVGEMCVPATTSACVVGAAPGVCPSGFPNGSTAATSLDDTRDCTCSCTMGCTGTLTLYAGSFGGCAGSSTTEQVDGTCRPGAGSQSSFSAYTYVASPICTPSPSSTGTVTPQGEATLCCP
jgi:hypothetical protein